MPGRATADTGTVADHSLRVYRQSDGDWRVVDLGGPETARHDFRVTVDNGAVKGCDCPMADDVCLHEQAVLTARVAGTLDVRPDADLAECADCGLVAPPGRVKRSDCPHDPL